MVTQSGLVFSPGHKKFFLTQSHIPLIVVAYAFSEEYEKAISIWNKAIERNPDYLFAYMGLTTVYQLLGNESKARECAAEVLRIKPNFSVVRVEKTTAIKNPARKKRWMDALRKAGLPD